MVFSKLNVKLEKNETTGIQNPDVWAHGVGADVFPDVACLVGMEQTEEVDRQLSAVEEEACRTNRQSQGSHLDTSPGGGDSGDVGGALGGLKPCFR